MALQSYKLYPRDREILVSVFLKAFVFAPRGCQVIRPERGPNLHKMSLLPHVLNPVCHLAIFPHFLNFGGCRFHRRMESGMNTYFITAVNTCTGELFTPWGRNLFQALTC